MTTNSTIKAVSVLAFGLLAAPPAVAHDGHHHGQSQAETAAEGQPNTAAEPTNSDADVTDINSEANTVESIAEEGGESLPAATILVDSFPIGWAEALFGLVLIFPWLLITLRKQLQTRL
ncbi:hypothetical protein [Leptolyngbya sp. Heron Island J]|uniref:hypothetical protein n=1 Tax=Leptolyngbya sp. Heron Island J TaxID=1385935 RepID=UPI00126818D2|nr:hypothetical protein [Leptolyngbya sp. Heron Island J]